MTIDRVEHFRGCLLGLAVGDALGTTLEFKPPGTFEPLQDMVGGGPFRLEAGQWTDDTSMALCLAASLVECQGFDARDQMERYVKWAREGYMSSNGVCFDIGLTVGAALNAFGDSGEPFSGSTHERSAGNGSIMRLAPVPMAFSGDMKSVEHYSAESSRTTHGTAACVDACRFMGTLIFTALAGASKEEILSCEEHQIGEGLVNEIASIAQGSYQKKDPPEIRGTGYVVESLEAALWAFHRSDSFREGCLMAVNLGDDADTTGAIFGQIAGAYYGEEGIPEDWRRQIAHVDLIVDLAEKLYTLTPTARVL